MKIAPIHHLMQKTQRIKPVLVHTGQHYDDAMSRVFFSDLELPQPDVYLGVGSGTHAGQTGAVMVKLEQVMLQLKPDLVLVVGDVNSTLATALVASKLHVPLAHVEAGLRSFDRSMPEEINRIVTDALADYLFVTESSGQENLLREGIPPDRIHLVGNVMIDSLLSHLKKARHSDILSRLNLDHQAYALLTLHRPGNVDVKETFTGILSALERIEKRIPVIYPIHPRSKKRLEQFQFNDRIGKMKNLKLVDPLGYLDFLHLMQQAKFVMSDSGGIQEETTVLGIPCLTLRNNTERPVTVELGTNIIVGVDPEKIVEQSDRILAGNPKQGTIPPLWDGKAAQRIVDILEQKL